MVKKGRKMTPEGFVKRMEWNGQIQRRFEECNNGEFNETDFPSKKCPQYRAKWTRNGYELENFEEE